jgi:hypothetical protein
LFGGVKLGRDSGMVSRMELMPERRTGMVCSGFDALVLVALIGW